MKMIRHEQHQPAVPDKLFMIVRRRGEHGITDIRTGQMIPPARFAVDGDEKESPFPHPRGNFVWQTLR